MGTTKVICIVTSEIVKPFGERPTEGFFKFNVEFSPMADPNFELGRPTEAAIELGRIVERGLRESRAIDSEALCLIAGEKVWSVKVDIHVIDNGGNLIDCSSIATVTALLHFRRPFTNIIGDIVTVYSAEDREPVALSIHHVPVTVTFAFFEDGEVVIVDPNRKEELVMNGRMSITLNAHREICAVQKGGGPALDSKQIIQCARIAAVKVEEIIEIIHKSLKQDGEARKKKQTAVDSMAEIAPELKGITPKKPQIKMAIEKVEEVKNVDPMEEDVIEVKKPQSRPIVKPAKKPEVVELSDSDSDHESNSKPTSAPKESTITSKPQSKKAIAADSDSDSEEEAVMVLSGDAVLRESVGLDLNVDPEDDDSPKPKSDASSSKVPAKQSKKPSNVEGMDLTAALKKKPKGKK
eukprot:TRINITY_DN5540_c0_g1_i2.p1 TRINITY_DN5540_c0_g1~~TRINITY_DN5540_c0_g1_i2.p1  ORF type:complete len:465 (-),score=146.93 TRINITY_DN5540_c0_g1_i2:304-1530(-)